MRTAIIIAAVLIIAIAMAACRCRGPKNPPPTGRLIEFNYVVSGTTVEPIQEYRLKLLDNGQVSLSSTGMSAPVPGKVTLDSAILGQVARIIVEHRMQDYKNSYQPRFEVLDGEQWHYSAIYDNEFSLNSGGHMAWPDDNGLQEICTLLDSCLFENRTEISR